MNGFKELLTAYLADHQNIVPPADPSEDFCFERDGLEWKISVRSGGELFCATIDCEDIFGWLWLQQSRQTQG